MSQMRRADRNFQAAAHVDVRQRHRHELLYLRILGTEFPGHRTPHARRLVSVTIPMPSMSRFARAGAAGSGQGVIETLTQTFYRSVA